MVEWGQTGLEMGGRTAEGWTDGWRSTDRQVKLRMDGDRQVQRWMDGRRQTDFNDDGWVGTKTVQGMDEWMDGGGRQTG